MHPYGHGGDILTALETGRLAAGEVLDFSANINPLGPPPGLYEYLAERLPEITHYPDPGARKLCAAIRGRYGGWCDYLPGNGAGELIYLLARALSPGPVLIQVPTFMLYERAAAAAGCTLAFLKASESLGFCPDTDLLCAKVRQLRPRLVILCNPNNPTGALLAREELLAVAAEAAANGGVLAVDEAFLEFRDDYGRRSMLYEGMPNNVVVICSLTKLYAIPGLRLGFLAGPARLLGEISKLRDPWSVNTLAQLAGEFVLGQRAYVDRTVRETAKLAGDLAAELGKVPMLQVYPPAANYLFVQSLSIDAQELQQRLLYQGVLIRDCSNYRGLDASYFRVAVRTPGENRRLCNALLAVL